MSFNKKIIILIVVSVLIIGSIVGITTIVAKNGKNEHQNTSVGDKDTTDPIIVLDDTYTVKTGYNGNLVNAIMSADDIDRNPQREIIGKYDLNKAGEYRLRYKITDSSNNITTKDFTLRVRDTVFSEEAIKFKDAKEKYKKENAKFGIDVSKWQKNIDWKKVKEQGIDFVIIRMGYQDGFDGEVSLDPYFKQNISGCLDNGISFAIYFSSYAKNVEEAKNQADWVKDNMGYNYGNLSVSFDWENWSSFNTLGMSLTDINDIANAFMDECNNIGFKPVLYGSKTYLEAVWKNPNNYPVWLAHYTDETDYKGSYKIWQFTQRGTIDGITEYVDINVMF